MKKSISDWQNDISSWAAKTFPEMTNQSIMAHLRKEVQEFLNEQDPIARREEAVDIVHLLLELASNEDWLLEEELARKFEINKRRKWGKRNSEGFCEHMK